jgi:hypothetical protein
MSPRRQWTLVFAFPLVALPAAAQEITLTQGLANEERP